MLVAIGQKGRRMHLRASTVLKQVKNDFRNSFSIFFCSQAFSYLLLKNVYRFMLKTQLNMNSLKTNSYNVPNRNLNLLDQNRRKPKKYYLKFLTKTGYHNSRKNSSKSKSF